MNKWLFIRIFLCIVFLGGCLYSYLDMQNEITELRIRIPSLTKEVRKIDEINTRLAFEIEVFESPENLMQLVQKSEYAYLKFPTNQEVVLLEEGTLLHPTKDVAPEKVRRRPSITIATGASP